MPDHSKTRICLIGAGPSGCTFLYHLAKLRQEGVDTPNVVCYERQSDVGGTWNYTWRTGVDEFGEQVHGSMYEDLWTNTSKEFIEYDDYRWDDHFGKKVPSYLPRKFVLDYLKGRWKRQEFRHCIRFNHMVKSVKYDKETELFTVVSKDLLADSHTDPEVFTHVVVAVGHFSTPHVPSFPGIESFPGRVIHSKQIRHFSSFAGKRILIVGSSYSGEDAAVHCIKHGSKSVILSWRSTPPGLTWPVDERPLLVSVEGSRVNFKDGSSAEVDEVILCTGYRHHYPFMEDELRLKCENQIWTPDLYKGVLFLKGGDNKLFYLSTQHFLYTLLFIEQEVLWTLFTLIGRRRLPPTNELRADEAEWRRRGDDADGDVAKMFQFQAEHMADLCAENGTTPPDVSKISSIWYSSRKENALTWRDKSCPSLYTGEMAPAPVMPFMEAFDPERVDGFLE